MFITTWSQAQTIDTFPFEEPGGCSYLHVGPEGDIWFSLDSPDHLMDRVMHVRDNELQCVLECDQWMGIDTITPDGTIWMDLFQYMYSPDSGLSQSGIQLPPEGYDFSLSGPGVIEPILGCSSPGSGGPTSGPWWFTGAVFTKWGPESLRS